MNSMNISSAYGNARIPNEKQRNNQMHSWLRNNTAYVILAIIILYTIIYSLLSSPGPSHLGDDIAYSFLAYQAVHGTFSQTLSFILSIRILQIYPIAFFYALFGGSALSSAAWDITCFSLSVLFAFLIGKELYDEYTGIIAAFLLAVFPLVAVYSVTMSDNIPMMFFVSLSAYSLLRAIKTSSRKWWLAAGATLVFPALVIPEGFIFWIIVALFLILELIRKKISINRITLHYIYGFIIILVALFLFNYINSGNPFITFTANMQYYGQTNRPDLTPLPINKALSFYPKIMFPYGAINTTPGLYFYVFIPAAIYLIFKKNRASYFLFFWFFAGLLYLEFGPQHMGINPFVYVLTHRLDRYLTLIATPSVILIAAAIVMSIRTSRIQAKYIAISISSITILLLVFTSFGITNRINTMSVAERFSQISAANYLDKLPNNTKIYLDSELGDVAVYMNFNNLSRFYFDYDGIQNCHNIPSESYVLISRYVMDNNFDYTPNPLIECPSWQLVLSPQLTSFNQSTIDASLPFITNLYHVP
jgi:hypothetical protein